MNSPAVSLSTAQRVLAFASMCVGMFVALLDIQIVSASLRDIGGGLSAGVDETVWVPSVYSKNRDRLLKETSRRHCSRKCWIRPEERICFPMSTSAWMER